MQIDRVLEVDVNPLVSRGFYSVQNYTIQYVVYVQLYLILTRHLIQF